MGLPGSCCRRIVSIINVDYRRMTHSPVHLAHENTTDFFNRLAVQSPWTHIAEHHRKLATALASKIQSLIEPAEPHQDVSTLSPAYPSCDMHAYVPPTPPMPGASLACPECHRHFAQVGMFKKHLRQQHQVLCLREDVFQSLRDSYDGRIVCRHCKHQFTTFYVLRDHITKEPAMLSTPPRPSFSPSLPGNSSECTSDTDPSWVSYSIEPFLPNFPHAVHSAICKYMPVP